MRKTYIYVVVLLLVVGLISSYVYTTTISNQPQKADYNEQRNDATPTAETCLSDDCLAFDTLTYPAGNLSDETKMVLNEAIDDEYKAYSTYQIVMDRFGSIRPFSMIIRAEEQHISSLKAIYDKYGLAIPQNNWLGKVTVPSTLTEACTIGVEAEIANAALYREKLLPAVANYPDITQVFTNLMDASQQKHLPAFEKCVAR